MHILITGGAGFLGARLARALLARGSLAAGGGTAKPITALTLTDRVAAPDDLAADPRVRSVEGDLNHLLEGCALLAPDTSVVFHLAAAVSGECEADFDLGMRSNYEATRALLEACRALGTRPVLVFASSLAVFGNPPGFALPEVIEDNTLPTPQSSYGIQKFIGEQLVADFGRKGFVQARGVRLMTVSVRPGQWGGVLLLQRHDPRAAGGCAGTGASGGRHARGLVFTRPHHRWPLACCRDHRCRLGPAHRHEPARPAHHGG